MPEEGDTKCSQMSRPSSSNSLEKNSLVANKGNVKCQDKFSLICDLTTELIKKSNAQRKVISDIIKLDKLIETGP